jgi:di- and tripeptidase
VLNPHLDTDSGDLFCLAWHPDTSTLYFGCQNTSIQWYDFRGPIDPQAEAQGGQRSDDQPASRSREPWPAPNPSMPAARSDSLDRLSGTSTPRRVHKFFDSYPQYERRTPDLNARNPTLTNHPSATPPPQSPGRSGQNTPPYLQAGTSSSTDACLSPSPSQQPLKTLQVPPENTVWSAHYGYVYCMAVVPSAREGSDNPPRHSSEGAQLVTGSGDASVKVRRASGTALIYLKVSDFSSTT